MHVLELFKVIIILESIFEQQMAKHHAGGSPLLSKLDIGKVKKYNFENTFSTQKGVSSPIYDGEVTYGTVMSGLIRCAVMMTVN